MWLPGFAHTGSSARDTCCILPGVTHSAKPESEAATSESPRDLRLQSPPFPALRPWCLEEGLATPQPL